jgi:cytidylate kinase
MANPPCFPYMAPMIIAIDGLTASGKGTLARELARHYGLARLDTGALYRAVGLALLDRGQDPSDGAAAEAAARGLDLNAIDEDRIRSSAAGDAASVVAQNTQVRAILLDAQRAFARQPGGAVLDGRDIGTVICPDADVKFYVVADLAVRARRRHAELVARGERVDLDALAAQIAARDERDMTRAIAPLIQAPDAHRLDTTALSIAESAAAAQALIDAALAGR